MVTPNKPSREQPSTYLVQDRSNSEELHRLHLQDRMTTAGMGGTLPELSSPGSFHHILDVGCGTGDWNIQLAQTYPKATLVGIDISKLMIEYARVQAEAQGLSGRMKFEMMDALRLLAFPENTFDLVNMRFGSSYLRTWEWPNLLSEIRRVTKPDGVIRITEGIFIHESSSTAFIQWFNLLQSALFQAGHLFEPKPDGLTAHIAPLIARHGIQQVQTQPYPLTLQGQTPEGQVYYEIWKHGFRTLRPFIQKWGFPVNYDAICEQAEKDLQQSNFYALHRLLTIWGHI